MNRTANRLPYYCERCKDEPIRDYHTIRLEYSNGQASEIAEYYCYNCRIEEDYEDYVKNKNVHTNLLLNLAMGHFDDPNHRNHGLRNIRLRADPKIREELLCFQTQLDLKVQQFQGKMWFDNGLQKFIKNQQKSFLSAHFKDWHGTFLNPTYTGFEMDIRCASLAGRFMITFEATHRKKLDQPKPSTSVTFITEEDSKKHRMGWQSVWGQREDILGLCSIATHDWARRMKEDFDDNGNYSLADEALVFGLVPNSDISVI